MSGAGFSARVRGVGMQRVVFRLDGRVVKTVTGLKNRRMYRYRVNVSKLARGGHRLTVTVTFRSNRTKTMRLAFQRCVRQVRAPQFTG